MQENQDSNPDQNLDQKPEIQVQSEEKSFADEMKIMEQKITELEQKNSDSNEKILRAFAELDNVRRRHREEIEKSSKFAISGFVGDLVVAVEHFFLACDNAPKEEIEKSPSVKNFADAIVMTRNELMKILEKNQVKRISPLNEKFDHNFHEAISQVASDVEEGTVLQVVQAGYSIAERLIRPALVSVSKKAE